MDPETVSKLDNGLTDLNIAVRQTDQTFLDVLGPMAAQIKEKLAKENNQAAADQDKVTNSLENSYSKAKQIADKQQSLYQQQLKRRGYEIDQSGKEVKVSQELSISQKALLERLDKTIAKEQAVLQSTNDPVKAFREFGATLNSAEGIWDKLQDKMFEMTGKSVAGAAALQGGIGALTGIVNATSAMSDAIYKGERGASVGAKGAKQFNEAVSTAVTGIGAALIAMPGSFLIKAFGAALVVVSTLLEKSTKLIEMGAAFNDKLYKSYNTLSEKGLSTAKGMTGLKESLHRVGLTGSEIDKFNKLLGDNSKNLARFGGTAATGMAKYEKIANAIATPSSKINKEFLIMGINSDAQREHIMKYMTEEDRLGLTKGLSDEQQIAGAKKYIDNLDKLSMITGTNRKELEEARATVMANENLRAAIFEAEQDKSEAGKARLAELKRYYEAAALLQAAGDTKGATGLAEYGAGRGITSKASAVASIQFGGKGGLIEGIKKGASSAELTTRAAAGYERQASMMADTGRFGGDTSGLMTGGFGQAQQFRTKAEELKKSAKEKGYGDDVTAYIEAEQKAKKDTKDKTTVKNAQVAQLQQETATIIDNTAFSMMKTADVIIGPATKLLGESTDMFADAVKKMAKEKGIKVPASKEEQTAALKTEIVKLKDSIRIKNKSIANLDPKIEANKAYIARMKSELETVNNDLANAEKKMSAITTDKKEAEPAKVPPGATIPTPPGPPAKGPATRGLSTPASEPSSTTSADSVLKFTSRTGSKGNFDALDAGLKNRVIAAAQEFNSMTGGKIVINSAKRDTEDQQRLWDETVKAGRPGIGPTGKTVGKPGRSKHERGLAVDIQNYEDPVAVAAMNKQGLFQTVMPKDPVHFTAAKTGGMFSGPTEGYFVQLHGKEFVGNEDQLDAIKKLLDKVEEIGLLSESSDVESADSDDASSLIIEKFTVMLESKADELLDKIKFGNRVDTDLLNYSQG
jgi:hypothetical protein